MASNSASFKVVMITGGASGMGETTARFLARIGWIVAILDLNKTAGEAIAKELGGLFVKSNFASYESQTDAFEKVRQKHGRIDCVYANAGVAENHDFYQQSESLPPTKFTSLPIDIDLTGVINTAYLAMHYMRRNPPSHGNSGKGKIVITASATSLYAAPALPLYTAAKHGVLGLTRSLAAQLQPEGIQVNCVIPGVVRTGLVDGAIWDGFNEDIFTTKEQVAEVVVGLVESDRTSVAAEVSQGKVYERRQVEFCDEVMAKVMGSAEEVVPY